MPLLGLPAAASGAGAGATDPLTDNSGAAPGKSPAPDLVFDGLSNIQGNIPPDPVGDVGPDHYIQMVNATKVAIFNKSGAALPPFDLGALWPASNLPARRRRSQVLYDPLPTAGC